MLARQVAHDRQVLCQFDRLAIVLVDDVRQVRVEQAWIWICLRVSLWFSSEFNKADLACDVVNPKNKLSSPKLSFSLSQDSLLLES